MHLDQLIPQLQLRRGDQYESTVNHPNAKHDTRKEAIDVEAAPVGAENSAVGVTWGLPLAGRA